MTARVPDTRIRPVNAHPVRPEREYVLYWMTALRRPHWNFALDRALELARELDKPLIVLEALRSGYRWASDRHHAFILQGMEDNANAFERTPIRYYPYVEPQHDEGKGLVEALSSRACAVVSDDYPCFFLPRMAARAAERIDTRFELVDGNGLLPVAAPGRPISRAYDFRRYLHRELKPHLAVAPRSNPLDGLNLPVASLPIGIERRWPPMSSRRLEARDLSSLPIDHEVPPAPQDGGHRSAETQLDRFVRALGRYGTDRNQPASEATSKLSAYLHYGHISSHEIVAALARTFDWHHAHIAPTGRGQRQGWWGLPDEAEAFLDQLVTWRELGFNAGKFLDRYDEYESLPEWARKTLAEHAADPRPYTYELEHFEAARTHDEIWNAAQRQLREEGVIHNYLRMLWGKKILHWSASPQIALATMIELNNKYALDGRDPNSYSGIFWTLGRYDRAWGPERPVFGKIRFMTSANTRRKLKLGPYLERWGPEDRRPDDKRPAPTLFD